VTTTNAMNEQHAITPPPELLADWLQQACRYSPHDNSPGMIGGFMAYQAAQWGADQELEACCKVLEYQFMADSIHLRAARRRQPPSLKARLTEAIQNEDLDTALRLVEVLDDSL